MVKANRNVIDGKTTWVVDPQEENAHGTENGCSPRFPRLENSRHHRSKRVSMVKQTMSCEEMRKGNAGAS